MEINDLPINAAPTSGLNIELSDGQRATLASLPIQSAVTAALALKAPLASPAFTGTPTGPTAATTTSTTQLATTEFVQQELAAGGSTSRSLVVSVRNQSGGTMVAGTVVYINGATGNLPTIAKALATSDATSAQTIGLVQTSIANNGTGLVVVRGILSNLNTSALTEGQQLYLSPTTAGTYTTTKQYAPNHLVYVGIVTRAHPTQGSIEVAVQNGFEMDELHNVSAQSPANGDTLRWNSATSLWEKSALGTLATQSGTFSGTSSGTNTGDQTATTVSNTPAGGIAATTVQAAINELDTEKTTPAAALAAADAADIAATAALVEREGLRFDGTAGAVIGGGGIPAVGTGDWSVVFSVNSDQVSTVAKVFSGQGSNCIGIEIGRTAGCVSVVKEGVGVIATSSVILSIGEPAVIAVVYSSGSFLFYKNGSLVSTVVASADFSAGSYLLGKYITDGLVSQDFFSGKLQRLIPWNYALTVSEIAALTRRGLVTLPEQRGGSMVALNTATIVNGCNGALPLTSFTGASSTGFTAVNSSGGFQGATSPNVITVKVGQKYRVNCTVTYTSGEFPSVVLTNATTWGGLSNTVALTAGVNSVVLTATVSNSALLGFLTNTNASYAISAVSIIPLGTLFEQDSGQRNAGYMVGDTSGNKLDLILPASGVSIIDPAMRGTIRFTTTTSGNQQIGGTQVIIPTNARITSWVINSSGTPNVTLGNVSAGAQYRASAAVVSGDNEITLLTRFTTTGNLWVNSSTTATLKHTIQWEYIQ